MMADPFVVTALTYLTLLLGAWAGVILFMTGKIMYAAKAMRGKIRSDDKKIFGATMVMTVLAFFIVFVWPGLIYMLPATVAFMEIASIPVLLYLTEISTKHFNRMNTKPELEPAE